MSETGWGRCPKCDGERFRIYVNRYGPRTRWSEVCCYRCGWLGSVTEIEVDHHDQEQSS